MQSFLWRKSQLDEKEKSNIMKNVLIIGLGRFGRHIAEKFIEEGAPVIENYADFVAVRKNAPGFKVCKNKNCYISLFLLKNK